MTAYGLPRREACREWVDLDRCDEPAVAILWGKLFPPEALGPRCEDHTAQHVGGRTLNEVMGETNGWAIYDLRPVNALYGG